MSRKDVSQDSNDGRKQSDQRTQPEISRFGGVSDFIQSLHEVMRRSNEAPVKETPLIRGQVIKVEEVLTGEAKSFLLTTETGRDILEHMSVEVGGKGEGTRYHLAHERIILDPLHRGVDGVPVILHQHFYASAAQEEVLPDPTSYPLERRSQYVEAANDIETYAIIYTVKELQAIEQELTEMPASQKSAIVDWPLKVRYEQALHLAEDKEVADREAYEWAHSAVANGSIAVEATGLTYTMHHENIFEHAHLDIPRLEVLTVGSPQLETDRPGLESPILLDDWRYSHPEPLAFRRKDLSRLQSDRHSTEVRQEELVGHLSNAVELAVLEKVANPGFIDNVKSILSTAIADSTRREEVASAIFVKIADAGLIDSVKDMLLTAIPNERQRHAVELAIFTKIVDSGPLAIVKDMLLTAIPNEKQRDEVEKQRDEVVAEIFTKIVDSGTVASINRDEIVAILPTTVGSSEQRNRIAAEILQKVAHPIAINEIVAILPTTVGSPERRNWIAAEILQKVAHPIAINEIAAILPTTVGSSDQRHQVAAAILQNIADRGFIDRTKRNLSIGVVSLAYGKAGEELLDKVSEQMAAELNTLKADILNQYLKDLKRDLRDDIEERMIGNGEIKFLRQFTSIIIDEIKKNDELDAFERTKNHYASLIIELKSTYQLKSDDLPTIIVDIVRKRKEAGIIDTRINNRLVELVDLLDTYPPSRFRLRLPGNREKGEGLWLTKDQKAQTIYRLFRVMPGLSERHKDTLREKKPEIFDEKRNQRELEKLATSPYLYLHQRERVADWLEARNVQKIEMQKQEMQKIETQVQKIQKQMQQVQTLQEQARSIQMQQEQVQRLQGLQAEAYSIQTQQHQALNITDPVAQRNRLRDLQAQAQSIQTQQQQALGIRDMQQQEQSLQRQIAQATGERRESLQELLQHMRAWQQHARSIQGLQDHVWKLQREQVRLMQNPQRNSQSLLTLYNDIDAVQGRLEQALRGQTQQQQALHIRYLQEQAQYVQAQRHQAQTIKNLGERDQHLQELRVQAEHIQEQLQQAEHIQQLQGQMQHIQEQQEQAQRTQNPGLQDLQLQAQFIQEQLQQAEHIQVQQQQIRLQNLGEMMNDLQGLQQRGERLQEQQKLAVENLEWQQSNLQAQAKQRGIQIYTMTGEEERRAVGLYNRVLYNLDPERKDLRADKDFKLEVDKKLKQARGDLVYAVLLEKIKDRKSIKRALNLTQQQFIVFQQARYWKIPGDLQRTRPAEEKLKEHPFGERREMDAERLWTMQNAAVDVNEAVLFATAPNINDGDPFYLSQEEQSLHILIIGPSGSGKGFALEPFFRDAYQNLSIFAVDIKNASLWKDYAKLLGATHAVYATGPDIVDNPDRLLYCPLAHITLITVPKHDPRYARQKAEQNNNATALAETWTHSFMPDEVKMNGISKPASAFISILATTIIHMREHSEWGHEPTLKDWATFLSLPTEEIMEKLKNSDSEVVRERYRANEEYLKGTLEGELSNMEFRTSVSAATSQMLEEDVVKLSNGNQIDFHTFVAEPVALWWTANLQKHQLGTGTAIKEAFFRQLGDTLESSSYRSQHVRIIIDEAGWVGHWHNLPLKLADWRELAVKARKEGGKDKTYLTSVVLCLQGSKLSSTYGEEGAKHIQNNCTTSISLQGAALDPYTQNRAGKATVDITSKSTSVHTDSFGVTTTTEEMQTHPESVELIPRLDDIVFKEAWFTHRRNWPAFLRGFLDKEEQRQPSDESVRPNNGILASGITRPHTIYVKDTDYSNAT